MPIQTANLAKPRRIVRSPINVAVDLTVTPPATSYNAQVQQNGVVPAGAIIAGELVYLTAAYGVASLANAGSSNANAASCIGVADDTFPLIYGAGIFGSSQPPGDPNVPMIQVLEDGDFFFLTTAGDTYHAYDAIYLGADGRTISKTATGSQLGYVSPDQRQSATTLNPVALLPISGGAGIGIYVRIRPPKAPF